MPKVRLVCLLPVRNGETDLPDYFVSVARFADAVVALDDGSTDATRELLDAEPLVKVLLHQSASTRLPGVGRRSKPARLLETAAILEPDWILTWMPTSVSTLMMR